MTVNGDPLLRKFLLQLSYRDQELLYLLADGKSIRYASQEAKLGSEKTLASSLSKLDTAFHAWSAFKLLVHDEGKGYRLTEIGRRVAGILGQHHRDLTDALVSIVKAPDEMDVAVTNDCLQAFGELQDHLAAEDVEFRLRPRMWRTADIYESLRSPDKVRTVGPCAFHSMVPPENYEGGHLKKGDLLDVDTRPKKIKQTLVLDAQPFRLLAPTTDFAFESPVDIEQVLEARWELVVPEGGAVYDFLQKTLGRWDNVGSRLMSTDLNAGLDILRYRLRPKRRYTQGSIMIVHGLADERVPPGYTLYDIKPPDGLGEYQALRGLTRDDGQINQLETDDADRWNRLWSEALKLWGNYAK